MIRKPSTTECLEYVIEAYSFLILYDRQTGKYWTKLGDSCDRTTWIDVALGLRAA